MKENVLGVALVKRACPACGALEDGEIVMNTVLTKNNADKVNELNGKAIGYMDKPCKNCSELIEKGFLLIGCIESLSDDPTNPYRSGHQWVITNEAAERMFDKEMLKRGVAFIDVEVAKQLGFPIEINNEN
jgi:hypothetical protein